MRGRESEKASDVRGPEGETQSPGKARTRRGGAAVPLDDTDKQLLNLMQGRFPLVERPFAAVADAARLPEAEVLSRVERLLDKRIIREITPIFDTRALGYQSMLVAAKVDARHPHRAAQVINSHPGVTHNYLRNHAFNLWFTIAVEPDSRLGLQGTLDVMAERAGADSIRQLPTLKLFKIRMDLEMEGGTEALAAAGEAAEPMELDPIALSDEDVATIRATQGPMTPRPDAYAPAAERLGVSEEEVLRRLRSLQERGGLRRVAAILFHRRAGFSANGMGVWAVPDGEILETGKRMAAFRGISHCYQRPTYPDWPYSVFTMAHGRSKEECDAILDSIAAETGIEQRATLYSSTEFKKVRMLYFVDDFRRWEAEHAL
jgi:DNA-binding Lrp family transcriptional regulator